MGVDDSPEIIVGADVHLVELPLVDVLVTSQGTIDRRPIVLVEVRLDDGASGWGECSALPTPGYTSEWAAGAFAALRPGVVRVRR